MSPIVSHMRRSDPAHVVHRGERPQSADQLLGQLESNSQLHPAPGLLMLADGLHEVGLTRLPPAAKRAQTLVGERLEQLRHGGDAKFLVDLVGALGTEAGHREQGAHARPHPGAELVELLEVPGVPQLDDPGSNVVPHRRDGSEPLVIELVDLEGIERHCAGRLLEDAHPVLVGPGDGQEVGHLPQRAGYAVVRARHTASNRSGLIQPRLIVTFSELALLLAGQGTRTSRIPSLYCAVTDLPSTP